LANVDSSDEYRSTFFFLFSYIFFILIDKCLKKKKSFFNDWLFDLSMEFDRQSFILTFPFFLFFTSCDWSLIDWVNVGSLICLYWTYNDIVFASLSSFFFFMNRSTKQEKIINLELSAFRCQTSIISCKENFSHLFLHDINIADKLLRYIVYSKSAEKEKCFGRARKNII
jgi:hypothetical protein